LRNVQARMTCCQHPATLHTPSPWVPDMHAGSSCCPATPLQGPPPASSYLYGSGSVEKVKWSMARWLSRWARVAGAARGRRQAVPSAAGAAATCLPCPPGMPCPTPSRLVARSAIVSARRSSSCTHPAHCSVGGQAFAPLPARC
jgi:hypothetical protein